MAEEQGITVKKSENFSEWYTQVLKKSELTDIRYNVKGFLVHMPWSVRIMKIMYDYIEKELENNGHEPVWFPAVIPESNLEKEKEHAKGFVPDVFWVTEGGSEHEKLEERLALRPTSETAMYPIFSIWIRSWRDLPFKTYQSGPMWRYESFTRPFIRGREFYWTEAHDVFATKEEAEKQVEEDMETTENTVHKKFAIPFLFFKRPEHDKFSGAVYTFAADALMPDGRAIQLPSTHFLGQNFSKAFDIKFVDKDKTEKYAWQTCYGPAEWRILGALAAIHGDDQGLILPPAVAPLKAVIVPIYSDKDEKKVMEKATQIKKILDNACIESKLDSRREFTPGWKYNYWELKGVPIRIEIGPKDILKKQVILVRRDSGKKIAVKENNIVENINKNLEEMQKDLIEKADKIFKNSIVDVRNFEELKKVLEERGGFARTNWCGNVECADNIKEKTSGGSIKGTLLNKNEKTFGKCVYCGKEAKEVVYIAKSY